MSRRLVLASNNIGKQKELAQLLRGLPLEVVLLSEAAPGACLPEETGTTFAANAQIKAAATHRLTGEWALSDDSGLCVDALGGAPGVYSARFAGKHGDDLANNRKLLRELAQTPVQQRRAEFVCVLCFATTTGFHEFEGRCPGAIAVAPAGKNGFGYDPLFVPDGTGGRTFAQLGDDEKLHISHRGRAFAELLPFLQARLSGASI